MALSIVRMSSADHPIAGSLAEVGGIALIELALSHPAECRERVLSQIRREQSKTPSYVLQALGLAERELGNIGAGVRHLQAAVRVADAGEDRRRRADVRASLATTLTLAGRTDAAVELLDAASELADGLAAARVDVRRGAVLWDLGRYDDALAVLQQCIGVLRTHNDTIWEGRALANRAVVHLQCGADQRAESDLERAIELFESSGQQVESARAWWNRAWLRYRSGDLPGALELLLTASHRFYEHSTAEPSLEVDRCLVLLAAGLHADALLCARDVIALIDTRTADRFRGADVELAVAEVALAAGDPRMALTHAAEARRLYRTQRRTRAAMVAALSEVRARWACGERSGRFLRRVTWLADDLVELRAVEAVTAQLLAGRIALAVGRTEIADQRLGLAAAQRRRGSALMRTTGWLAQALRADAAGSSRAVFSAARAGLRVLDEHRLSLGATEMRAAATAHGAELAALAVRHAAKRGPRDLLIWSERWRATTLALPPVRPPKDKSLTADLGRLREVTHKASEARTAGLPAGALDRERRRLEGSIRSRTLTTRGDRAQPLDRFDLPALLASLGDRALVSIVDVDGDLHVLVAAGRQVRRYRAGRTHDAAREVDFARFGLRTAAGTGEARAHAGLRRIDATADRLQAVLLGEAVRALGDRPLVVVPPAKLHATPWAVLPALRRRAFTVAPSAASWMRARRRRPPRQRRIVLVAGPDLGSRGAEIDELHRAHPDAAVFADETAACDPVLKELDGAWLAHVAAHGVLRPDNPLFSALALHDGPLTVYDLERLRRAPYRLILSACESGIGATTGADEVLGLASALISLGTAGLMGSVVVVDDDAAVRVSLAVHERLRVGDDLSHALLAARTATAGAAVDHAAALAFLPLGAA